MKKIVILVLLIISFENIGHSQSMEEKAKVLSFTPLGNSGVSNIVSNVSFSSTFNAGQNAKAELKYTTKNWTTLGLSIDQKINEGANKATPIDILNGIASGTKVGINFQKMHWNPQLSQGETALFDSAADLYCSRTGADRRTVTRNNILKDGNEREKRILKGISTKSPIFFNIQAFFEKTSHNFSTDSITLAETTANYITPSASVSIMLPSIRQSSMWILSYSYAENYTEGDNISFTTPFGPTNHFVSKEMSFGAPVKTYNHKAAIEYRKGFISNDKLSVAINPAVAWGSANHSINFTLPIYFIQAASNEAGVKGLQGGFMLGYSGFDTDSNEFASFSDGFGAQVFITAPFNIFGEL